MNDIHGEVGIDVERLRAADPDVFHKVVFFRFLSPLCPHPVRNGTSRYMEARWEWISEKIGENGAIEFE
ncbi:MAG: hypothetical protein IJO87_03115 [Eggerthellaceae bacterium]|nr:hypothetical protein [Eggerthellaceae bacterium]MBR2059033.1 hypothetical protein [Fibrobacter sp.]